jgi:hypothetical protein
VRLPGVTPLGAAILALGGASFLCMFGIAFSGALHGSVAVIQTVWGALLAFAVVAGLWQRNRIANGLRDIVIDQAGEIILPAKEGRKVRRMIADSDLKKMTIDYSTERTSKGGTVHRYRPTLTLADGSREILHTYNEDAEARGLVDLLHERFGWPALGA